MSARDVGIAAMFGWIPATFRLVSRNFGAMTVATLLSLLVGVAFSIPLLLVMFKSMSGLGSPGVPMAQDMTLFWVVYCLTIVASLILGPPLLAGWFRLCQAADRDARPSGAMVLSAYRDTGTWVRLVVVALLGTLMYLAAFALLFLVFRGVIMQFATMQAAQMAGGTPPPPSLAMVGQILLMYVVVLPLMFLLQMVYMVAMVEVSLRPTAPVQAFLEAIKGVLRNALKLLLFMFCLFMGFGAVIGIVVLVFALLAVVLSLLSPVLMAIVIGLVYILLLVVLYPLMFAGNYHAWKDIMGATAADTSTANAVAA